MMLSSLRRAGRNCLVPAALALLFVATDATANLPALTSQPTASGGQQWSLSLETLLLLSSLSFLPAALLMMTAFTRIIIVLSLLRTAMGTQSVPPNQVILGIALFTTLFVMSPVLDKAYESAWVPFSKQEMNIEQFAVAAVKPFREFMLAQTRETDLERFAEIAKLDDLQGPEDVPLRVLLSI